MSGFQSDFVGWNVGFLELPDKARPCRINPIRHECRECRVVTEVESYLETEWDDSRRPERLPVELCLRTSILDSSWTPQRTETGKVDS